MQQIRCYRDPPANNRTPRLINRNVVFHLIRKHQPVARVDLADLSGLRRSTISLIARDLLESGWIVESPLHESSRRRQLTGLQVNKNRAVVALDLSPNRAVIAVVNCAGEIFAKQVIAMPDGLKPPLPTIVRRICNTVVGQANWSIAGVGVCLPGRASHPGISCLAAELEARLKTATGFRVDMNNAANGRVLSEAWFGMTEQMHDLVVINVSDDIETGIFAHGRLLRGEGGTAGQFGHIQIEPAGPVCVCGSRGCWQTVASNCAAVRFFQESARTFASPSFSALLKMGHAAHPVACAALMRMATHLGAGMRMINSVLAPRELIVIGDITKAWHLVQQTILKELQKGHASGLPRVRPAYDGVAARLRGAAALAFASEPAWVADSKATQSSHSATAIPHHWKNVF